MQDQRVTIPKWCIHQQVSKTVQEQDKSLERCPFTLRGAGTEAFLEGDKRGKNHHFIKGDSIVSSLESLPHLPSELKKAIECRLCITKEQYCVLDLESQDATL